MSKFFIFWSSLFLYVLCSSVFIVFEGEKSIILRFGKIVKNHQKETVVYTPGYHFKWPVVETVTTFDSRVQSIHNQDDHFLTKDNKDLIINSYIKWRINDFGRYYLSSREGNLLQVRNFLKRQFNNQLINKIRMLDSIEIISNSQEKLITDILNTLNKHIVISDISLLKKKNNINELGIEIVDIHITSIAFPVKSYNLISDRIQLKQKLLAYNYFIEGEQKVAQIRSDADDNMSVILSEAYKQADIIKSTAKEKIVQLFVKHFSQMPDFYFLMQSSHMYDYDFQNNRNIIFMNINNPSFQYINHITDIIH